MLSVNLKQTPLLLKSHKQKKNHSPQQTLQVEALIGRDEHFVRNDFLT